MMRCSKLFGPLLTQWVKGNSQNYLNILQDHKLLANEYLKQGDIQDTCLRIQHTLSMNWDKKHEHTFDGKLFPVL